MPEEVAFATKPAIALDQIRQALADGVPPGAVVTGAGYGDDTDFRDGVTALGLAYVTGIQGTTTLWPPGAGPLRPRRGGGPARGRVADRHLARGRGRAAGLALRRRAGPAGARRYGTERAASRGVVPRRVARGRGRADEYWLSTLPEAATLEELVATAKLRWRVERDLEELKQELGLGHFEGRGWRGFHHHASLCIAAYGFLVAERCRSSSPDWRPRLAAPERPADYRPRNSSRAPRAA